MEQMDTETLRLLLAVAGVFLIASVYIWGRYKKKMLDFVNQRGEYDELEDNGEPPPSEDVSTPAKSGYYSSSVARKDPPISVNNADRGQRNLRAEQPKPIPTEPVRRDPPRTDPLGAPFLIQISVVAKGGFFNGLQLRDTLDDLRLIYGDMGIYHRYDREYRVPLFSVASLVEPGTFPIKDMENFECPGVVLFFQPPQVDEPLEVFDDLVATCHELAIALGGVEWDEKHQPLTSEKISQMRGRLREAS